MISAWVKRAVLKISFLLWGSLILLTFHDRTLKRMGGGYWVLSGALDASGSAFSLFSVTVMISIILDSAAVSFSPNVRFLRALHAFSVGGEGTNP